MGGLCESGKTQLFSRLCYSAEVTSVTSMHTSTAQYNVGKKSLTVVDVPGHERIRYAALDNVKATAGGVMFLLDSASIQKDLRDVAEFLYSVLCDESMLGTRFLIVCNKQDLPTARAPQLIQKMLEKEMTLLRETRTSQLDSIGDGSNKRVFLGKKGEDFEFSQLQTKIQFVEAVTKNGENLESVTSWLNALA